MKTQRNKGRWEAILKALMCRREIWEQVKKGCDVMWCDIGAYLVWVVDFDSQLDTGLTETIYVEWHKWYRKESVERVIIIRDSNKCMIWCPRSLLPVDNERKGLQWELYTMFGIYHNRCASFLQNKAKQNKDRVHKRELVIHWNEYRALVSHVVVSRVCGFVTWTWFYHWHIKSLQMLLLIRVSSSTTATGVCVVCDL